MKIHYENSLKEIKNLVSQKAKFQKVMLIYDDCVSNLEIAKIHGVIKDLCVYNHCHISAVSQEELNDGYRLLIFRCSAENFLKFNKNLSEFISVIYPCENGLLPFFLTGDNTLDKSDKHLLLDEAKIDINLLSSIHFNLFFNYFQNIIVGNDTSHFFEIARKEITQQNAFESLNDLGENTFFIDLNIIKNQKMRYEEMVVVDLILINALQLLIESVKQKNIMLVDVYKAGKDDEIFIEKSYKLFNNDIFANLIILNYNCLINFCKKTKDKIKELISFVRVDTSRIDEIFKNIKNYSKKDKGLIAYLYLFNFFNV